MSDGFRRKILVSQPPDCVLGLYNTALLITAQLSVMDDAYFIADDTTVATDADKLRKFMIMAAEFGVVSESQKRSWQEVVQRLQVHLKTDDGYLTQWIQFKVLLNDALYLVFEALKRSYNFKLPGA